MPPAVAREIIPDLPNSIRQTLASITYSSGCRVVIGLDHPPLPPGWKWDYRVYCEWCYEELEVNLTIDGMEYEGISYE